MMATHEKRREANKTIKSLERNIQILEKEIRETKAQLSAMRVFATRARCKVDLVSRSAEKERKARDASRNAQQWASTRKQMYVERAENAESDARFYKKATSRSYGADGVIQLYKERIRAAEKSAASNWAEAAKYSHVGYHRFDLSVIAGFSTDKDAYSESQRRYAETERRYVELIRKKKRLQRQLSEMRRK